MNAAGIAGDQSGYAALTRPTRPLLKALVNRAYDHYTQAQELLRQGNCAGYAAKRSNG